MTVSSETNTFSFAGAGTTGPFTFANVVYEDASLAVYKVDALGIESLLALSADYTVSIAGDFTSADITTVAPVAVGEKLTIVRSEPQTQLTDYVEGDEFPAASHERALDRLVMIDQQQEGEIDRCMKVRSSDVSSVSTDLPIPTGDKYLQWNSTGTALVNADLTSVVTNPNDMLVTADGSTTARDLSERFADVVNVKDWGAVGDGVTDDTTAIQAAIDAAEGGVGAYAGTGRTIYFPTGVYVCGDLEVAFTGQRFLGESKYGTWLLAKSGAECVIKVGGIDLGYPVGNPLRNINRRETVIQNLTIEYSGLTDTAESAGIRYQSSYGNTLQDVVFQCVNENTKTNHALYFGEGCYTTVISAVTAKRIRIYSPTTDKPTTLTFIGVDSSLVDIDNALGITFLQPIMQSVVSNDYGTYRMSVVNCDTFTCIGGDWEDDNASNYMYYFDNVSGNIISMGNATVPFQGGYMVEGGTGITGKRLLQDDMDAEFQYREGTWTPVLSWATPGTSTITPTASGGYYIRNGNLVTCSFYFDNATFTNGTASGNLHLTGLPFQAANSVTDIWGGSPTTQIGFPTNLQAISVVSSLQYATFKKNDGTNITVSDVSGSGKYMRATFSYQCDN